MFLKWTRIDDSVMAGRPIAVVGDNYSIERVDGEVVSIAKDHCSRANDEDVYDACMFFRMEVVV